MMIMNRIGYGRKQSEVLSQHFLGGTEKTMKSLRIVDVPVKI
jgi:hypothetical protein